MDIRSMCQIPGMIRIGQISHPRVNGGQPLPLFEPIAPENHPSINTMEGWNSLADKQNRRSFAVVFGREPNNDAELRAWEAAL